MLARVCSVSCDISLCINKSRVGYCNEGQDVRLIQSECCDQVIVTVACVI